MEEIGISALLESRASSFWQNDMGNECYEKWHHCGANVIDTQEYMIDDPRELGDSLCFSTAPSIHTNT